MVIICEDLRKTALSGDVVAVGLLNVQSFVHYVCLTARW